MEKLTPFARRVLDHMVREPDQRDYYTKQQPLAPVSQSACVQQFADRIRKAIDSREKVLVAGDYDCDGILATSMLVDGLRKAGLEPGFYVPDRMEEGYGLSPKTVQMAHERGYSLLITVDNGVEAHAALEKAAELGVEVIVNDHHQIQRTPKCSLLVHPSLMEKEFGTLCGAGLVYELLRALQLDDDKHLQWAATASVADCMVVRGETRAIIQQGIRTLNEKRERHLCLLADSSSYNEEDIGFQIAPRINSVGRLANLANANNLVRYFLSDSPAAMARFAAQLNDINEKRKEMSRLTVSRASGMVRAQWPVLLAADPSFHEGVVGLAAGKLCEETGKPVIVGAINENCIKCSMRAPEGFDCMAFLEGFEEGYVARGGHAGAAGFTLSLGNWEKFSRYVFTQGTKTRWEPVKKVPLPVDPDELTVQDIRSLDTLRPFGKGFELPPFEIDRPRVASFFDLSAGKHRKFTLADGLQCLHFNQSENDMARSVLSIERFVGRPSINSYHGRESVNFLIDEIDYGPSAVPAAR